MGTKPLKLTKTSFVFHRRKSYTGFDLSWENNKWKTLIYGWTLPLYHFCSCRNYEHIVKAHQNNPQQGSEQVSDQVKFSVFQSIMDSLFQSFSASVSVSSFQELSACVFSWIEEHCKPQVVTHLILSNYAWHEPPKSLCKALNIFQEWQEICIRFAVRIVL